ASVLQLTKVTQGNFLKDSGDSTLMVGTNPSLWNNTLGTINGGLACSDATSPTAQTTDTSGVLVTLTFQVVGYGVGNIILSDALLLASSADWNGGTPTTANNAAVTALQPPASLIEVFTDRGGTGVGANSGAYGPQDLVQMYALVTYNNASVASQAVSFCVQNSIGSVIALRVVQTNTTG